MEQVRLEGFHAVKHALRFAPDLVRARRGGRPDRVQALAARLAPDLVDGAAGPGRTGAGRRTTPACRRSADRPGRGPGVPGRADPRRWCCSTRRGTRATSARSSGWPRRPARAGWPSAAGRWTPGRPRCCAAAPGCTTRCRCCARTPAEVAGPVVVLDADGDPSAPVPAAPCWWSAASGPGSARRWRRARRRRARAADAPRREQPQPGDRGGRGAVPGPLRALSSPPPAAAARRPAPIRPSLRRDTPHRATPTA